MSFLQRMMTYCNRRLLDRLAISAGICLCVYVLIIPTIIVSKHGNRNFSKTAKTVTYYQPLGGALPKDNWQVVSDGEYDVYLYSAFFDDRPNLKQFHVRMVGIAETAVEDMICLLWYRNRKDPDVISATMTFVGKIVRQDNRWFQGVLFSCEVPPLRWPPELVSLNKKGIPIPSNMLRVQMPVWPPMQMDIAVCVPLSYGNVSTARFSEWIEILSKTGVTNISMYDNGLASSFSQIINHYAKKGIVNLKEITFPMKPKNIVESRKLLTAVTINDCFYRNAMEHSKIVVLETDEIIVPRMHDTFAEMFTYIDDNLPAHPGRSYLLRGVYFWLDQPALFDDMPYQSVTRYLERTPPGANGYGAKSITDTQVCLALNTKQCQELLPPFKNMMDWLVPVNVNISLLHHYKKCDLDDTFGLLGLCNKSLKHMMADPIATKFYGHITTQVLTTLAQLGLVDVYNLAGQTVKETMMDEMAMQNIESQRGTRKGEQAEEEDGDNEKEGSEDGNEEKAGKDDRNEGKVGKEDRNEGKVGKGNWNEGKVGKEDWNEGKVGKEDQKVGTEYMNEGTLGKEDGQDEKVGNVEGNEQINGKEDWNNEKVGNKGSNGGTNRKEKFKEKEGNEKKRERDSQVRQRQMQWTDIRKHTTLKDNTERRTVQMLGKFSKILEVTEKPIYHKDNLKQFSQYNNRINYKAKIKSGKNDDYSRRKTKPRLSTDQTSRSVALKRGDNIQLKQHTIQTKSPHQPSAMIWKAGVNRKKTHNARKYGKTKKLHRKKSRVVKKKGMSLGPLELPFPIASRADLANGKGQIKLLHIIEM